MEFSDKQHSLPLLLLFLHLLFFISIAHDDDDLPKHVAASNNKVSALLVFGDSTVDPGNNNNLTTVFKSNFRPYGREFASHMPTGRFSDGRLTTDFVASHVGVKENLPPYLDSTLSIEEMMTGVSFASAGSGYDPLTPMLSNVIPISKQLQYFREYKKRLESATGKQGTENHIKKAIFIVSAGTNDFVVNYYSLPIRRRSYTVTGYHQFLLEQVKDFVQVLLFHHRY